MTGGNVHDVTECVFALGMFTLQTKINVTGHVRCSDTDSVYHACSIRPVAIIYVRVTRSMVQFVQSNTLLIL